MKTIKKYLGATVDVLLPRLCGGCNTPLMTGERHLCLSCTLDLPYSRTENDSESAIEQLFWGRVPLQNASAMLQFTKGGLVQNILHNIKYKGNTELALFLGKEMGHCIASSKRFKGVDIVAPVPLHKAKERKRGFNQSAVIAQGLTQAFNAEFMPDLIKRVVATATQTKRGRLDRWRNVGTVFQLTDKALIEGKHVLLIDDVITTGATLEGCIAPLLAAHASVSVYAAAVA